MDDTPSLEAARSRLAPLFLTRVRSNLQVVWRHRGDEPDVAGDPRVLAELVVGVDQWDRIKSARSADGGATTPSTTPRSTHDDDDDEPTPPSSAKEVPRFSIRFAVPVESSERTSSVGPSDDDVSMSDSTDGPWSGTPEESGEVA